MRLQGLKGRVEMLISLPSLRQWSQRRSNANGRRAFRKINLGFRPSCFGIGSPQRKVSMMAKTEKDTVETQAPEAPSSETDLVKAADVNEQASDTLAAIQTALSLNTSGFSDEESGALKKASVARYREFAAVDATDRVLATLSVGLQNAVMTSLEHAAGADMLDVRSEELRNATRGAKVVADLLEALDRHRGRGKQSVTVGQVTVETGGQAIVGNVNSEGKRNTEPEETENPTDDPSRAKE
jgi:hypothetical protein